MGPMSTTRRISVPARKQPTSSAYGRRCARPASARRRSAPSHEPEGFQTGTGPPSRLPYGTPLSAEALRSVERAEEFLRERFGLRQVRVRDHMPVARIELEETDIPRLLEAGPRAEAERALRDLGWRYTALDLRGFRTGSMNEALS
jgi:hypothetical protein